MKNEEPEVSEELRDLKTLSEEMQQHSKRISALSLKGELTNEMASAELASTVMPLLADLATAQLKHAAFMEEWTASLEEDVADGSGNAPDLSDEELDTLGFCLARLRDFVQGAMAAPDAPPELKQGLLEIEVKLNKGEKILERLSDAGEEQAEDESEDGDDDDTGDTDGNPDSD